VKKKSIFLILIDILPSKIAILRSKKAIKNLKTDLKFKETAISKAKIILFTKGKTIRAIKMVIKLLNEVRNDPFLVLKVFAIIIKIASKSIKILSKSIKTGNFSAII